MSKYEVEVTSIRTFKATVEADSPDEAIKIAEDLEYTDMVELNDTTDYEVINGDEEAEETEE